MLLVIVDLAFSLRLFSGLSQQEISGQNGANVKITIDGHAESRIMQRLVLIYVCVANPVSCIIISSTI